MEKFKKKLKFEEMVVVEAMEKSGGMTLIWNNNIRMLEVLSSAFTIEAHVVDPETNWDWWFIGIYTSSDAQVRRNQWKVIKQRRILWGDKWLLAGDFNDIISNDEKWGGRIRDDSSFKDFKGFLEENELTDLGFNGKPWTWCNNWMNEGEIKQRLERALANNLWSQSYDRAKVVHVENQGSDHSMIFIDSNAQRSGRKKRFYFDKRWLKKEGIEPVTQNAWKEKQEGSNMF